MSEALHGRYRRFIRGRLPQPGHRFKAAEISKALSLVESSTRRLGGLAAIFANVLLDGTPRVVRPAPLGVPIISRQARCVATALGFGGWGSNARVHWFSAETQRNPCGRSPGKDTFTRISVRVATRTNILDGYPHDA
eukprot:scaffold39913_cov25-Prasinocladus_malaysianus.AAC.1